MKKNKPFSINFFNYKINFKQIAREALGFKLFHFIRKILQGQRSEFRRNEKNFNIKEVKLIIDRLNKIDANGKNVTVCVVPNTELKVPKLFSKKTFKVFS